ncbi:hypothetical protein HanIR_Chr03g0146871 [Helianthus annuus]|nr:hypothetical protein HanIR_Chr03g0146871 [Helianthus annuus]
MSSGHFMGLGSILSISPHIPCKEIQKLSREASFCLISLALTWRLKACNLSFPLL